MITVRIRGLRRGECAYALVDADILDSISRSKWHLGTDGYARRKARKAEKAAGAPFYIAMHRQVLGLALVRGAPGLPEVDHIDRNRLNNTRMNLRTVDRATNSLNSTRKPGASGVVGVSYFRPASLWKAYIDKGGKRVELGYFHSQEGAVMARKKAEVELGR